MNWNLDFLPEARKDMKELSGNQSRIVAKAIDRVSSNPLPRNEGGYGIPLGVKGSTNLTGFLEIKMRGAGLRVVYKLIRTEQEMLIVIVGVREDEDVYEQALKRIKDHRL